MTTRPKQRRDGGFTIQELLVVLIVGSLLVTFSLSLFLFAGKLFSSWQRHSGARRSLEGALQVIASDIQKASSVTVFPDSVCLIDRGAGKEVEYRFTAGSVLRNGVSMETCEGERFSGRIAAATGLSSAADTMGLYHIELKVSMGGAQYSAECDAAAPRSSLQSFARAGWRAHE